MLNPLLNLLKKKNKDLPIPPKLIEKPWGKEEVLEFNSKFMVKRLTMWKDQQCSLQYHNLKLETVYVLAGTLLVSLNGQDHILIAGSVITIKPGEIHRMRGITDCVYLESSTPEMEDVVRLKDDYGRTT